MPGGSKRSVPLCRLYTQTAIGAFLTVVVAVVLIIVCGELLYGTQIDDAAAAAIHIMPRDRIIGTLIAIGLFDAGLLGAICISLASSWAFGEVFGWAHSLNQQVRAPSFNENYRLIYFTRLFKRRICARDFNRKVGKLTDLVFKLVEPFPEAVGLYVEHSMGRPDEFIPWDKVIKIDDDAIFITRMKTDSHILHSLTKKVGCLSANILLDGQSWIWTAARQKW
jgi:sporulation protein YlmC with PRC-barrel domain